MRSREMPWNKKNWCALGRRLELLWIPCSFRKLLSDWKEWISLLMVKNPMKSDLELWSVLGAISMQWGLINLLAIHRGFSMLMDKRFQKQSQTGRCQFSSADVDWNGGHQWSFAYCRQKRWLTWGSSQTCDELFGFRWIDDETHSWFRQSLLMQNSRNSKAALKEMINAIDFQRTNGKYEAWWNVCSGFEKSGSITMDDQLLDILTSSVLAMIDQNLVPIRVSIIWLYFNLTMERVMESRTQRESIST